MNSILILTRPLVFFPGLRTVGFGRSSSDSDESSPLGGRSPAFWASLLTTVTCDVPGTVKLNGTSVFDKDVGVTNL